MGSLTGQAMLAWLVVAIPMVALTTLILTKVLRHIPAVAAAELAE
jgi:heme exporter protein D